MATSTWDVQRSMPPQLHALQLCMLVAPHMLPHAKLKLMHSLRKKETGGMHMQAKASTSADCRLPSTEPCCNIPPFALSKGRGWMRMSARSDGKMGVSDAEVAEWVARVIRDPMLEVDPKTLALHRSNVNKSAAMSAVLSNSVRISTGLPPYSFHPRGMNALALGAAGAFLVMVVVSALHSLKSHATNHGNLAVASAETMSVERDEGAKPAVTDLIQPLCLPFLINQDSESATEQPESFDNLMKEKQYLNLGADDAHNLLTDEMNATAKVIDDVSITSLPVASIVAEEAQTIDQNVRDARKALQAAVPALTIGVGTLGIFAGIDGGLEMVGVAATASFISYELLWAKTREKLWQEIRRITDREKLLHFLKARKIWQNC